MGCMWEKGEGLERGDDGVKGILEVMRIWGRCGESGER